MFKSLVGLLSVMSAQTPEPRKTDNDKHCPPVAYQVQGDIYFHDGREIELLEYVFARDRELDIEGKPKAVLEAIDAYGREKNYLMNVGDSKGILVEEKLLEYIKEQKNRPLIMFELGAYVGYSAIAFARLLPPGSKFYSFEVVPEFAAVSTKLVELAGLRDTVRILVGPASELIPKMKAKYGVETADIVFLDHIKERYLPDLDLLEEHGFVKKGTMLIADNVIKPGNPPYLAYVRGESPDARHKYKSEMRKGYEPYTGIEDAVEISICIE